MSRTGASAAADGHLPATLDWQTASIVRRNDRALIVLELPTSTSSVATIPMTGSTLRRQAAEWGFVPLTGSGRVPTNPTDWEVWHTSAGLVVRLRERGRALLACIPAANIVKRADLKLGETTDLLIAVRSPSQFRTFNDFVRTSAKEIVAGQALVGAVPHSVGSPRYSYVDSLGVAHRQVPIGAAVFVDQNVLIDMRAALLGDSTRNYSLAELRDNVAWLAQVEGIPGFAIAECRARQGQAAADELGAAWEAWIESRPGLDSIEDMALRYRDLLEGRGTTHSPQDKPSSAPGRGLAALNYFALLSALEPWSRIRRGPFKPDDHLDAYEEWLNALDHPLLGLPGHMGHAVRCLLLGKPGTPDVHDAARLLKVAKQRAPLLKELHGAAFDMLYPTLCDMANAGALPGVDTSAAFVLTADSPLVKARARVESGSGLIIGPSGPVGFIAADADYLAHYSERQVQRIRLLESRADTNAALRLATSNDGQWQFLHSRVDELETELLLRGVVAAD